MNNGASMNASAPYAPHIMRLWRLGTWALVLGLVFGIVLLGYLTWSIEEYVGLFAVVPIALFAVPFLLKRPDLFLYTTLAGFVVITSREAGVQLTEAIYGLLFLGYLASWYFTEVFLKESRLIYTKTDWALFLFLSYAFLSASWAMLFGASLSVIVGEVLILIMMAFYFPIASLIRKHPDKVKYILLILAWIGVYVSIRNILEYRSDLSAAEKLYHVLSGRVALNEVLLMMPALGALTFLLYAKQWNHRIVLAGLFILFFACLIVTQSRGYWLAFFLGAFALFLLIDLRRKVTIMVLFASGIAGFVSIGFLIFPAYAPLVLKGMIERFTSLGTAITSDLSLVNRFYESMAVWEYIKANPILGYGIGTPYEYFNIISDHNRVWAFIHNGYLGMWYKYGIIGLSLLLFFWFSSIWHGIKLFRTRDLPIFYRVTALACAVCLIGETLVANTSTPFQSEDPTLMITMMAAIILGLRMATSTTTAAKPAA
ncbi:MAG: O-antigen ligase family protein [Bacteroidota bacterium]